jgi:hypothetical protein
MSAHSASLSSPHAKGSLPRGATLNYAPAYASTHYLKCAE